MATISSSIPSLSLVLHTNCGDIPYTLIRKKVKNINLRVRTDGSVSVSAPLRTPIHEIEFFMASRASWVLKSLQEVQSRPPFSPSPYTKEECLALFTPISNRIFPLFADILNGQKPMLRVREMKTRWGVCHIDKRIITLNMRLATFPLEVIEYVILHEYVHFIHPNHQTGFHTEMARLMPDYKQRRKLLR